MKAGGGEERGWSSENRFFDFAVIFCYFKLSCDERFAQAFTACGCVFKEITLVGSKQGNYFENATACSKRTLKTTVATQLKRHYYRTIFLVAI